MIRKRVSDARAYLSADGLGPFLVRALAGSGAVQLVGMGFTFLTGVMLARGLGVRGYGYYGMAMAIITIATLPGAMGLPKLVVREVAAGDARGDPAAMLGVLRWADRTSWRISLAVALLVGIGAGIAFLRGSSTLGVAVLLGAPMLPLLPLANIRAAALRALHQVVLSQIAMVLLRPLLLSLLLFALFLAGQQLTAPGAVMLTTAAAFAVLLTAHNLLKPRLPRGIEPRLEDHRRWLSSLIPLGLTDAMQSLQWQLATLALGLLATANEVGVMRVATSTAVVIGVPAAVMASVALPMYSRLHTEGDHRRFQALVTHTARIQFSAVLCLALPLFIAAGPLLSFFFGVVYAPAASTLQILCVGQLISTGFGPTGAVLNMTGHERRVTRAVAIALALNALLVLLLAPRWGSDGTAVSVVAGQLCWNALLWNDARRLRGINTSIVGRSRVYRG